jgi:hypothetical protein
MTGITSSKAVMLGSMSAERTRLAAGQLGHDACSSPRGCARRPDDMTVFLTLIAILVPASVTLTGYLFTCQSAKRLDQKRNQENGRLKLDAAMRAADLSDQSACAANNEAKAASGWPALGRLDPRILLRSLPALYHRVIESGRLTYAPLGRQGQTVLGGRPSM